MASTPEGCFHFCVPPEGRQALTDSWNFLTGGSATDGATTGKPWAHGLLSCADNLPLTGAVCLCPCFAQSLYFNNLSLMSGKSCEVVFVNTVVTSCVCLNCCYYAHVRTGFRKKYGLEGSPMTDMLYGCCCGPCAVCSDANELMTVDNTYKVPYVQLPGTGGTAAPAPAKAKEAPAKEEPKAKEEPAVEAQAPAS